MHKYLSLTKRQWISIALITAAAVVVSLDIMLIQQSEYRSDFSLLVIEKDVALDGYAAAKSAERLSTSLGNIVYTASFFNDVQRSGLVSPDVHFSERADERQDQWKKMIETRVFPDIGIIRVSVFHKDRDLATNMADALSQVIVTQGPEYLGGGNSVVLRVVDSPVTTEKPARPDILFGFVSGALLGFLGSFGFYVARKLQHGSHRYGLRSLTHAFKD